MSSITWNSTKCSWLNITSECLEPVALICLLTMSVFRHRCGHALMVTAPIDAVRFSFVLLRVLISEGAGFAVNAVATDSELNNE